MLKNCMPPTADPDDCGSGCPHRYCFLDQVLALMQRVVQQPADHEDERGSWLPALDMEFLKSPEGLEASGSWTTLRHLVGTIDSRLLGWSGMVPEIHKIFL